MSVYNLVSKNMKRIHSHNIKFSPNPNLTQNTMTNQNRNLTLLTLLTHLNPPKTLSNTSHNPKLHHLIHKVYLIPLKLSKVLPNSFNQNIIKNKSNTKING